MPLILFLGVVNGILIGCLGLFVSEKPLKGIAAILCLTYIEFVCLYCNLS